MRRRELWQSDGSDIVVGIVVDIVKTERRTLLVGIFTVNYIQLSRRILGLVSALSIIFQIPGLAGTTAYMYMYMYMYIY